MGDVLLKLDDALLMDYRRAADSSGRTLEDELREALTAHRPKARLSKEELPHAIAAARPTRRASREELIALSERLWAMTPASAAQIDSTPYIRAERDRR